MIETKKKNIDLKSTFVTF